MTGRAETKQAFLVRSGWDVAVRAPLAGDASGRSYDRLRWGDATAVLMDAPPDITPASDGPAQFLRIARHLRGLGLSAPAVLADDLDAGFLLLEDLGDALYARQIGADPGCEALLYAAATDVLVHLQAQPRPTGLPDLTAAQWAEAATVAFDWYRFAVTGTRDDTAPLLDSLAQVLTAHADGPRVMILRDFHSENLLWLPDRQGLARVGLLDFQLAQGGQPGYDLVSLLQDARRDVQSGTETAMISRFASATGQDETALRTACSVLGAQRALRILGVFARLCLVTGKPGYLPLIPRVWDQLQRNLAHPALQGLAAACATLPFPSPEALNQIEAQCGRFR